MNEVLLRRHLELVIKANKITNITKINTWEEGMLLHVKDSLIGLKELNEAPAGWFADIGTGAGYPGIPLAIESGRNTLLVDSVQKKIAILQTIIADLNLQNVTTYAGRIEDLARVRPCEFAVVTARALAKLSILMELAAPLLKHGGRLICYKANVDDDELNHALLLQEELGMEIVSDRREALANHVRRILCFEKQRDPLVHLPRKTGFAQKKPL